MSDWRKQAKKLMAGKWVKFDPENPSHVITFQGEPAVVDKTAQTGPNAGETYQQLSFPVECDGEPKLLEPNRSLLAYVMDEDATEDIIGRTFIIKCMDLKSKRQWKMTEQASGIQKAQWSGKEEAQEEEEEEKPRPKKKPKAKDPEKEKFMKEVEKRKAAKKEEITPAEPESEDNEDNGSGEEAGEAKTDALE